MLRALLFDLDGTLADTDPLHFAGWEQALATHGVKLDAQAYRTRISGRLNPDIVRDFLPALEAAAGRDLTEAKERWYRARLTALSPIPGLEVLLSWAVARGLPAALVTNAPRDNAVQLLAALGLADRFAPMVLGGELARGKPDPLPYLTALEQLDLPSAQALAFEDSPAGIAAAVAAEIPTVALTTTHPAASLRGAGAFMTVADFADPALRAELERRCV